MANNSAISQGGVLQATDVNFEVLNSTIANNSAATSGGAFYLSCSLQNLKGCQYDVNENSFSNNSATVSGGALFYDLYSPANLANNSYAEN